MNTANTAGYPSKRRQIAAANRLLDPAVRREIRADPKRYALDNGLLAADAAAAEVRVVTSTRDTLYIQLPNPRAFADTLDAPTLKRIQAAACTGTAGSTTSASTLSTGTSTAGSLSSASTLGTAGSGE
ncbi:MAG: hypothetical protein OXU71_06685 [Gammaproteobacteria bacterium]|nr:hypothetical protein [Gammaproteobacteria bacterium]MDD9855764.1 hypothetical protein [Gammaproteobacteria bacterium]MDD9882991.1 hypothetical protein [Gammaproteobacteria bacterium]